MWVCWALATDVTETSQGTFRDINKALRFHSSRLARKLFL